LTHCKVNIENFVAEFGTQFIDLQCSTDIWYTFWDRLL